MYKLLTSSVEVWWLCRLKEHYSGYEAQLTSLQQRYESASKEKALAALERDRALSEVYTIHVWSKPAVLHVSCHMCLLQVSCLQATLQSVQGPVAGHDTSESAGGLEQ